jgi:MFS family permease
MIVSLLLFGALVGALVAGVIADIFGRKPVIIVGASLGFCGAALHTGAVHLG